MVFIMVLVSLIKYFRTVNNRIVFTLKSSEIYIKLISRLKIECDTFWKRHIALEVGC